MSNPPKAQWEAGGSGPIGDEEAPTAFYRRPKRGGRRDVLPAPLPSPRTGPTHRRRPTSSTPSPPTLLLPTGEVIEDTADGTILSPLKATRSSSSDTHALLRQGSPLSELVRRARELWTDAPSISVTSAVLILSGVIVVSATLVCASVLAGSSATSVVAAQRGVCGRSSDLGRRLLQAQHDEAPDVRP